MITINIKYTRVPSSQAFVKLDDGMKMEITIFVFFLRNKSPVHIESVFDVAH